MRTSLACATVVILVVGCSGSTTTSTVDASVTDAEVDATRVDARPLPPDGQFDDGGGYATEVTPNSVICGLGRNPPLCDARTEMCCGRVAGATCIDQQTDGGQPCSDLIAEICDGPEDCPSGEVCCATGDQTQLSVKTVCKASCAGVEAIACHNHTQCPSDKPLCCTTRILDIQLPSGACATMSDVAMNVVCDTP